MENIIKCPYCDTEYLIGEVYLPKYFLGQPFVVERDISGKIIYTDGVDQDSEEKFCCMKCNKTFNVKAEMKFTVTKSKTDIDQEYISQKYSDRILLKEE